MAREEPLPRWAWPVMGVALVAFALLAWSLRLQQARSLEVRDPDGLVGPAELVAMRDLGVARSVEGGPFVHGARLAVPFAANPCPTVRLDVISAGPDAAEVGMRVINGDCDDIGERWVVLVDPTVGPEETSLFDRTIAIRPLDETPPRRASSEIPYGIWSPPFSTSSRSTSTAR